MEELTPREKIITAIMFISPFLLVFGGGAAYIYHVYVRAHTQLHTRV